MTVTVSQVGDAIIDALDGHSENFPFEYDCESHSNNGMCDEFAMAICADLGHPENLQPDSAKFDTEQEHLWGHVWLKLTTGDKVTYFDSESPDGVDDPELLEFFNRDTV